MRTVNVRVLVRNDLDDDTVADQLVRGVIRVHGAVPLQRNGSGQLVKGPSVHTRPHVTWSGNEDPSGA